uniref:Uncharacterized protein n=1 Tax=Timema tahoe TaxID=61484 RepID=A0A7R9IJE7_9NEOP|nr:unnamed protein product [Timema tahoe]
MFYTVGATGRWSPFGRKPSSSAMTDVREAALLDQYVVRTIGVRLQDTLLADPCAVGRFITEINTGLALVRPLASHLNIKVMVRFESHPDAIEMGSSYQNPAASHESLMPAIAPMCTVTLIGLYSFVLSKRSVDRHRYEDMKVRERMRNSNEGECEVTLNSNHG